MQDLDNRDGRVKDTAGLEEEFDARMQEGDYRAALELSAQMPWEEDRRYYRAVAALGFYQDAALLADPERPLGEQLAGISSGGLPNLQETAALFEGLMRESKRPERDCRFHLVHSYLLLEEYDRAYEAAEHWFVELYNHQASTGDQWTDALQRALAALTFYQLIAGQFPRPVVARAGWLNGVPGLPTLAELRDQFAALAEEPQEEAWACHLDRAMCCGILGDDHGAAQSLDRAETLRPGDPDVAVCRQLIEEYRRGADQAYSN